MTTGSKPPGKPDRIVAWLQRVNAQSASVLRWVAIVGMVYAAVVGRADLVSAFVGLAGVTFVVGKPREG